MKSIIRILSLGTTALALGACSSMELEEYLPEQGVEYKRETQAGKSLEVPPDLTSTRFNDRLAIPDSYGSVGANYSEFAADRRVRGQGARVGSSVLPANPSISVQRDRDRRWLKIGANADAVWDRMLSFWEDQGVLLEEQDPGVGVMRTSWLDNRAAISRDIISNTLRTVFDGLYDAGLRDSYRVRLEPQSDGTTELYLTHYGMEEIYASSGATGKDKTVWVKRPRDPELEAIMLNRAMVFLGAADDRARAQLRARSNPGVALSQLVQGRDGTKLIVGDQFPRAWRLVGLSLDRIGFAVEDRDRSQGLFYVRYNDPAAGDEEAGILSSLKFWEDEPEGSTEYRIRVAVEGDRSVVTVLDSVGNRDNTDTSKRILKLLQEQIR